MIHIAGKEVVINNQLLRQRCAWCGLILVDLDATKIMVPEGSGPIPSSWPIGALVAVDESCSSLVQATELPDDCCAVLEMSR